VRRAIIFSPESEFPSGRTARLYPALSSLNMPKVPRNKERHTKRPPRLVLINALTGEVL
jgi:hypothetical protein